MFCKSTISIKSTPLSQIAAIGLYIDRSVVYVIIIFGSSLYLVADYGLDLTLKLKTTNEEKSKKRLLTTDYTEFGVPNTRMNSEKDLAHGDAETRRKTNEEKSKNRI